MALVSSLREALASPNAALLFKLAHLEDDDERTRDDLAKQFLGEDGVVHALSEALVDAGTSKDILDGVCTWLHKWLFALHEAPRRFVVQFVPALLWALISHDGRGVAGVEGLLLAMGERAAAAEQQASFAPPTLSAPSVYHSSLPGQRAALTADALLSHNVGRAVRVGTAATGAGAHTALNRADVLHRCVAFFHAHVAHVHPSALGVFADFVGALSCNGYSFAADQAPPTPTPLWARFHTHARRLPLDVPTMLHLCTALDLCMHTQGVREHALWALTALHLRASHHLHADVMLATSALLHLAGVDVATLN